MCGRFTRLYTWKQLHALLSLQSERQLELPLSYNVAPSQQSYVCRVSRDGESELVAMRWGLTPTWSMDGKPGPINARAETVATNGMFRSAYKSRRCIVPVSGFYEWKAIEGQKAKQPYYIHAADEAPLLFAGLWESWSEGDKTIESFTIITTEPNAMMATIHNRMPVILDAKEAERWLDSTAKPEELEPLLRPAPDGTLGMEPVSTRVNAPKNDDAGLIQRIE